MFHSWTFLCQNTKINTSPLLAELKFMENIEINNRENVHLLNLGVLWYGPWGILHRDDVGIFDSSKNMTAITKNRT